MERATSHDTAARRTAVDESESDRDKPGLRPLRAPKHRSWHSVLLHRFSVALHWFEVGMAALTVLFVCLGVWYLLRELLHFDSMIADVGLHVGFEELLSDILLLVVGIELAIMLVRRTPESLVEVMFFVIARKMLIKTDHVYELLIGVAALAGLFAIRKYLEHQPPLRQRIRNGHGKQEDCDA